MANSEQMLSDFRSVAAPYVSLQSKGQPEDRHGGDGSVSVELIG